MTATVVAVSDTPIAWNGGGGPTTPGIPDGTAAGMLLLLPILARSTGVDINLTDGYTLLSGDDVDQGTACVGEIQGKIAGSSESAPGVTSSIVDTQPTCAFLLAVNSWSGVIGDVFVATPNTGSGGLSPGIPAPDATALVDDTLVIRVFMQGDDNTVTGVPDGHTQLFFQNTTQGSDANIAAFVMDDPINSGENAGTANAIFSGSDPYIAWTILVPPADTGGTIDLTVADTAQGQTVDSPTLTQTHVLSGVADTAQGQTAESVALTQVHVLDVANTVQGQTAASAGSLTQQHFLAVQDAVQGQTAESVGLSAGMELEIQKAVQGQLADSPTLTQLHSLVVQDTAQGQISDRPVLTQVHVLSVQDSAQGQTADNLMLTVGAITTPTERSFIVVAESRIVTVSAETRVVEVEAETRVVSVVR